MDVLPAPRLLTPAGSPAQLQGRRPEGRPLVLGMQPEFEQWCKTSWLPSDLGRDFYRKQAETHIQGLAAKSGNHQKAIEDRASLLDERNRLIQQCLWLQNEATTLVLDLD